MSNIKKYKIVADVPFSYLSSYDGMPTEDIAALASLVLTPATECKISYKSQGFVPNSRGGHTAMYRVTITGTEALSALFLRRVALALRSCEFAQLHVAKYRDIEDPGDPDWHDLVFPGDLIGQPVE